MPDLIRVSRDVYGAETLGGMSWDLIPYFFGLGLVIIIAHAVYSRWFAPRGADE